jgi:hypothetical protein
MPKGFWRISASSQVSFVRFRCLRSADPVLIDDWFLCFFFSGKLVALRDVHNMIQRFKTEQKAGLTDAERALAILDEFSAEREGNVAEMMVDADSKVARVICFQSARMKRLFRAFPEVVLVDATHDTNANRYKLFSFAVHDVFGKVCVGM